MCLGMTEFWVFLLVSWNVIIEGKVLRADFPLQSLPNTAPRPRESNTDSHTHTYIRIRIRVR